MVFADQLGHQLLVQVSKDDVPRRLNFLGVYLPVVVVLDCHIHKRIDL